MHGFVVSAFNRPGELARVTAAIAARRINIRGFFGMTTGGNGTIFVLTSDESGTREALQSAGVVFREVEIVSVELADEPGTLNDAARRLSNAGVNVEAAVVTGASDCRVSIGFATDNPARAREALGG